MRTEGRPATEPTVDDVAPAEPAAAEGSASPAGTARPNTRPASATRVDLVAMALYVLLPAVLYTPFSLDGRPLLGGDNLYQNFPLRVLAGRLIAAGHVPAWDPLIWSGTPLLAGWNAGALFPGTWLFAVLPPVAAWTVNLVLTSALAAAGAYGFVRLLGCGSLASFLAGLVYAYTGFMSGQLVHLGLVQGTAMLPWLLVGLEWAARRRHAGSLLAPVALIAVATACTVLAGDPRAASTSAIAAVLYLLAWALRDPAGLRRLLPAAFAAAALGAALSAVQWLPGIGFLRDSQRTVAASAQFAAGSLSFPHLVSLMLVPFMLGGSTNFGLRVYQGVDNIQELTIGVGFVALAAAAAYLPALARSLASWTKRMARPGAGERGAGGGTAAGWSSGARPLAVWYVVGLCGVVLVEGADTRLGSYLVKIPLYGGQRLQNRNAELIDLALVVLLAFFVDDLAGRSRHLVRAWRPLSGWVSRSLAALVPVAAITLIVAAFVSPLRVERELEMPLPDQRQLFSQLGPYLVPTAVLAAILACYLLLAHVLPPRVRRGVLAALVLADVLSYALDASYAAPPVSSYSASAREARAAAAATGAAGRFALFDPLFSFPVTGMTEPNLLGIPDLNVLQDRGSVEGYGSIVNGAYADATGTHGVEDLTPSDLTTSIFDSLDLTAFLTLPVYVWRYLPKGTPAPIEGDSSHFDAAVAPPAASGPYLLEPGQSETFVLGAPSALVRASAILDPEAGGMPATLRIAEGTSMPARARPDRVRDGVAVAGFPDGVVVDSVVVQDDSPVPASVGAVTIVTRHPAQRYVLDGLLQGSLAPPHWSYGGTIDNFVVYRNTRAAGPAWLQPSGTASPQPARRLAGGSVTVSRGPPTSPVTMRVDSPRPAELVRSEGADPGWSATITPTGRGQPRVETAQTFGVVQMVRVPAGRSTVTWHYAPRSLREGEVVTLAGALALLALLAVLARGTRRRRRAPGVRDGADR